MKHQLLSLAIFTIFPIYGIAQNLKITGSVTDIAGDPIIGANIIIKGQKSGTITDIHGNFSLSAKAGDVLKISYIGYTSQEIKISSNIVKVRLSDDASKLDEVVVTSFGYQKKLSVVGAIQTIDPTLLQRGTTRSLSNNLAGQLAGIIAFRPSGEPGYDNSNFWIRGIASFSGNNTPLVLVDGVERNLNDLDPAEIESFSILKDASASAMYGVRGANGVILINTKRGKVSAPSIDFRIEHAISSPTKLPKFLDAPEYMEFMNTLSADMFSQEQIEKTRSEYDPDLYPNVNWLDAVTKDYAYSTRANITVSGGTNILRYSLTTSIFNEQGIMEVDNRLPYDTSKKLTRYNMRANVDLDLTKTTLIRFNVGGYLQFLRSSNSHTDVVLKSAFETPPFVHPVMYSDGTIPILSKDRSNPWAMNTQQGYDRVSASKLESLFSIEQNLKMLLPGLKAKVIFAFDTWNSNTLTRGRTPDYYTVAKKRDDEGNLIHNILSYGSEFLGHSTSANYGNQGVYLETSISYDYTFNTIHDISALFLYNQRSYDWGDIQPKRTQGIAGRLSYTLKKKYIGEFNFGYNGSENFAKGSRFGFFPSLALGYIISEEKWMQPLHNWLNLFKFRGSIGKLGNDDIGGRRFAYITTINSNASGYNWGYTGDYGRSGVQEGDYGVPDLTWETSLKANIGFEIGLFNALNLQVDFFKERRSNIFMQRSTIPTQIGYITNPWANYGIVDNKGIDLSLNFNKRFNKNWSLSLRGNFTYAKNIIIECDEPNSVKGTYRSITGHSINTLWGYTALGLYTKEDFNTDGSLNTNLPHPNLGIKVRPGDIKYKDMNNDGLITDQDLGFIGGTTDPRITYGFGGNITFQNIDFNFFFQGNGDTYRIIGGNNYFIPGSGAGVLGNIYINYRDSWTEDNPSQNVFWPRLSAEPNPHNEAVSTWWRKNMSFLRVKLLEIGYTIPSSWTKKIFAKNIRLYISGNDLLCFSSFKLWDPELDTRNGLQYPGMRSIMFGIDLNF